MVLHRIKKGLDLPVAGEPAQEVEVCLRARKVASVAADYVGMRPTMRVQVGDSVRRGQLLYDDKKMPGVRYTAPGAGTVAAIHRGERRSLQSVVIELSDAERAAGPDSPEAAESVEFQTFDSFTGKAPEALEADEIRALLIESGLWTALRARPFSRSADPSATPRALFVTAMSSEPLAPSPEVALRGREEDFLAGLRIVSRLTAGPTYLCKAPGAVIPAPQGGSIRVEEFEGPHPAGLVGTHIHLLAPASRKQVAWHLHYQDVVSIGRLFATGRLSVERIVALGGPGARAPRLLSTRVGASTDDLVSGELLNVETRVISGSILSGRTAMGDCHGFLGRFHLQISVLAEGRERELFGWAMPGAAMFSTTSAFLSSFLPKKKWAFTTTTYGSKRAMVPIGMYERVMPLDILPTFLLRSLIVGDVERAEQLGCLELDEEDLALCTFVCPGKIDYGPILRDNLTTIEKEG